MPPSKLLIFGNPKAGTPLMQAVPSLAIDLPLKILAWEAAQGKGWVSSNSPEYLQERHGLPHELLQKHRRNRNIGSESCRIINAISTCVHSHGYGVQYVDSTC